VIDELGDTNENNKKIFIKIANAENIIPTTITN
jgi:hypothetical protein